ncbi:hypothetical protein D9M68_976510 [compost metagenome]
MCNSLYLKGLVGYVGVSRLLPLAQAGFPIRCELSSRDSYFLDAGAWEYDALRTSSTAIPARAIAGFARGIRADIWLAERGHRLEDHEHALRNRDPRAVR